MFDLRQQCVASLLKFVFITFSFLHCEGFATLMVRSHCNVPLVAGETIMGQSVLVSEERTIKVFRGKEEVPNQSFFFENDELEVYIEPSVPQIVLEVAGGAKFVNGGCTGAVRSNTNGATLRFSATENSGVRDVSLIGGWANTFSEGVKITSQQFVLRRYSGIPQSHEITEEEL